MAKFGHTFIAGLLWVLIFLLIAVFGRRIPGVVGTVVSYSALVLAGLFGWHLARITRLQWLGLRLMHQDPERFARLKQEYEQAISRTNSATDQTSARRDKTN